MELEGSSKTHGSPLGEELIKRAKDKAGFPSNKSFFVPEDVLIRFRCAVEKGELLEREWRHLQKQAPLIEQNHTLERLLNPDFSNIKFPEFNSDEMVATRDSNGKILNAIARAVPKLYRWFSRPRPIK